MDSVGANPPEISASVTPLKKELSPRPNQVHTLKSLHSTQKINY